MTCLKSRSRGTVCAVQCSAVRLIVAFHELPRLLLDIFSLPNNTLKICIVRIPQNLTPCSASNPMKSKVHVASFTLFLSPSPLSLSLSLSLSLKGRYPEWHPSYLQVQARRQQTSAHKAGVSRSTSEWGILRKKGTLDNVIVCVHAPYGDEQCSRYLIFCVCRDY